MDTESGGARGWPDLLSEGRLPLFSLICLGVFLNAADSLVTATILPSVGAELGGYAYFGWTVAGFMIGAILAGASAGRLSELFGLRAATTVAGAVFTLGCLMSAAAPSMSLFIAGRMIQGVGSGWVSGFLMVAIAMLFPERHLARVFASVSGVWGIATLIGPLFGGFFAERGDWRMVFWLFALLAVLFSVAAPLLLRGARREVLQSGVPWRQLALLGLAVGAIAFSDGGGELIVTALLVATGLALLTLLLRVDHRARVRMLPHRAGDLSTVPGAGYAALFALTASTMGLSVYGPSILQELRGLTPLWAGYVVAVMALSWTLAAITVAGAVGEAERRFIRLGTMCVPAGALILAVVMHRAPLPPVILGAATIGIGFGLSNSLINRHILAALSAEDRAIGSSALMAVRQTGSAVGAAIAGAAANFVGFDRGLTPETASAAGLWVFVTALPLALAGALAARRMTRQRWQGDN